MIKRTCTAAAATVLLASAGLGLAAGVIGWDTAKPAAVVAAGPVIGWDAVPAGTAAAHGVDRRVIGWD
ncbi:hypothetical protein [Streptomyces sp. NPDC089919]|uniref:hypothetical protein n=1 Tax=Streptomyces sp. NPDC089919 TaxID=3155188 RepID=UPI00341C6828